MTLDFGPNDGGRSKDFHQHIGGSRVHESFPVLDVSGAARPRNLDRAMDRIAREFKPGRVPENDRAFQAGLIQLLREEWPEAIEIALTVTQRLETGQRYTLMQGFPFLDLESPLQNMLVLAFGSVMGHPTATDPHDTRAVWDICPVNDPQSRWTTFSEDNRPAELHTDSQYLHEPERYVALFSVIPAKDGGISTLLDGRVALESLTRRHRGIEALQILRDKDFPFRVPTIYTVKRDKDIPEIIEGRVTCGERLVRYRYDTMRQGLQFVSQERRELLEPVLELLRGHFENHPEVRRVMLERGDVLFTNNHEILHGRTHFTDINRRLLRMRVEPEALRIPFEETIDT